MYQLITENLGICILAFAGIVVGVGLVADHVLGALQSWDPIEVDRGEIVERDQ